MVDPDPTQWVPDPALPLVCGWGLALIPGPGAPSDSGWPKEKNGFKVDASLLVSHHSFPSFLSTHLGLSLSFQTFATNEAGVLKVPLFIRKSTAVYSFPDKDLGSSDLWPPAA